MSLCPEADRPEADRRAAMDDGEFWDHVFHGATAGWGREPLDDDGYDDDFNVPAEVIAEYEMETRLASPCPECGQVGPCSYDAEGRPMIHVSTDPEVDNR